MIAVRSTTAVRAVLMCMCGTILFINGALSLVISKSITAIELSAIYIGNHMISSAFWDKSARVNFSKAHQIA